MKSILISALFVGFVANAQKTDEVYFNKLKEIENTNFVVTYSKSFSKIGADTDDKLVFIETELNTIKEINFNSNLNISNVITAFDTKYQNANFILVETSSKVEKTYPKASNTIRELYLIKLNTFEIVKISTANYTMMSWVINKNTDSLVLIEMENGNRNGNSALQKIVTIPLKTGLPKDFLKLN